MLITKKVTGSEKNGAFQSVFTEKCRIWFIHRESYRVSFVINFKPKSRFAKLAKFGKAAAPPRNNDLWESLLAWHLHLKDLKGGKKIMEKEEKEIVERIFELLLAEQIGTARGYAQLLGLKIPDKEKSQPPREKGRKEV